MTTFIAEAPEPKRSSATMTLSWGTLNIPVSVYTATEETRIPRKEFVDGDTSRPAGRAAIDKSTGELVKDSEKVVRMVEASNGVFVEFDDYEVAACTGQKGVAEILTFIQNEDILSYVVEKAHQVRPPRKKGIPDPAASKAFGLLLQAMATSGASALVRVALRGPAKYAVLTATGDLLFVHSTEGVRKPLPLDIGPATQAEVEAATALIDSIGITEAPVLPDVTAKKVMKAVNDKASGQAPVEPAEKPVVVDIMAELQASIEASKTADKWDAPSGQQPVEV